MICSCSYSAVSQLTGPVRTSGQCNTGFRQGQKVLLGHHIKDLFLAGMFPSAPSVHCTQLVVDLDLCHLIRPQGIYGRDRIVPEYQHSVHIRAFDRLAAHPDFILAYLETGQLFEYRPQAFVVHGSDCSRIVNRGVGYFLHQRHFRRHRGFLYLFRSVFHDEIESVTSGFYRIFSGNGLFSDM